MKYFYPLLLLLLVNNIALFAQQDCPDGTEPPAIPNFTFTNNCLAYTFTVTNPIANHTYTWQFGNGQSGSGNTANHTYNLNNGAFYDVILTVKDNATNCTNTKNKPLSLPINPDLIAPNSFSNCDGGNFSFRVADESNYNGVTNYTIDWGDGQSPYNSSSPPSGETHEYTQNGVFTLIYTLTQGNCTYSKNYIITNVSNPAVGAASPGNTQGCHLNICFTLTGIDGNDPATVYTVDFGDDSPARIYEHNNLPDTVCHTYNTSSCDSGDGYEFSVEAVTGNCTPSRATISPIVVGTKPIAALEATPVVCVGETFTFDNTTENGYNTDCSTTTTVLWDLGDGTTEEHFSIKDLLHSYETSGTYTAGITVKNNCGEDEFSLPICVEEPFNTLDFTLSDTISCQGQVITTSNVNFQPQPVCSGINYDWSISPSSGWEFVGGDRESENPSFQFNNTGTFTIILVVNGACTITTEQTIEVTASPTVNLTPLEPICEPIEFTPSIIYGNENAIESVTWTFEGGNPQTSTELHPTNIQYNTPGEYLISIAVQSKCGTTTDSFTLVYVNTDVGETFAPVYLCDNESSFILDSIASGSIWSGEGVSNNQFDPSIGSGLYDLTYTFSAGGDCSGESNLNIEVFASPIVSAGNDLEVCSNSGLITLTDFSPAGGVWSGEGIVNNNQFDHTIVGNGTHILTYTYIDSSALVPCTTSEDITVTVYDLNVDVSNNATSQCNTDTLIQLLATPENGTWSGNGVTPEGIFNPSTGIVGTNVLVYTVIDNSGCEDIDSISIEVVEIETVEAGENNTLCQNDAPIELTGASPSGGVWQGVGVNGTQFDPSLAPIGDHEIVYIIGLGTGSCEIKDSRIITILPTPTIDTGNEVAICFNEGSINLTATPTGGTWNGEGITDPAGVFTPFDTGDFLVTYSFTNEVGCTDSAILNIYVEGISAFGFGVDSIVCTDEPLNFEIAGGEGGNCTWDFGDGQTSSDCSTTHTYTQDGNFTISLTITTPLGCQETTTQNIFVTKPPEANFEHNISTDSFLCTPLLIPLTNISNTFGTSSNVIWDFGNGDSLIIKPDTLLDYVELGTYTFENNIVEYLYEGKYIISDTTFYIRLRVENACGTNTYVDSVKVAPTPQIIFSPAIDEACSGTPIPFNNISLGNADFYEWNFGDGTPIITTTTTDTLWHTFEVDTIPQIYTVTVRGENDCGVDIDTVYITVKPKTVLAFFHVDTLQGCSPLTITVTDFSTDDEFGSWDFGDGNVGTGDTLSHTFDEAGEYLVQRFVDNGCSYDTTEMLITVLPAPVLENIILTPNSICAGKVVEAAVISSSNINNYEWFTTSGDSSTLTSPSFVFDTIGTHTVNVITTSTDNGCIATLSKEITVTPKPIAEFIPSIVDGCSPLTVTFLNTSTTANYYVWDFGNGNTSSQENPIQTFESNVDTSFWISLVSIDSIGCADSTGMLLNVYGQPMADFEFSDNHICEAPVTLDFINTSESVTSLTWNFGNGQTSTNNNPSVTFLETGTYPVTLIVSNPYGCQDTIVKNLFIYPQPKANFEVTKAACEHEAITFINNTTNATEFLWKFGNGDTSTTRHPIYTYKQAGNYPITLIASYDGYCIDSIIQQNAIEIFESPTANFRFIQLVEPKEAGIIQFLDESENAISQHWDFGTGDTSIEMNPTYRFYDKEPKVITLTIENEIACQHSKDTTLTPEIVPSLHIPNALQPTLGTPETRVFQPKGSCLATYQIWIYDKWGTLLWHSNELDDGQPKEAWTGEYKNELLPQGAYTWEIDAVFEGGIPWQGVGNPKKKTGTIMLIR